MHGPTNLPDPVDGVYRLTAVIELKPEKEQLYRELHTDVWPDVVEAIKTSNIRNYSISLARIAGKSYLFSYMEYTGDDIERDFAAMANDPVTRDQWWPITDACQRVIEGTPEGAKWLPLERLMLIE
ncbi:L-rhamnose mutarotase [Bacteroidota bacterium]